MKNYIASLHANQPLTDMETDAKHSPDTTNHHQSHPDLPAIIAELTHDIANSVLKMQALFQKLTIPMTKPNSTYSSATWIPEFEPVWVFWVNSDLAW